MSTHLLLEAAARSLVMGAIVLVALRLLRIEQIRARRTAWLLALAGALCMPLLVAAQIGPRILPAQQTQSYVTAAAPVTSNREELADAAVPVAAPTPAERSDENAPQAFANTLLSLAVLGYCTVAAVLGLRLCAGVGFAMRLRNRAERIVFPFDAALDVRTSPRLATPVTVGSTVLLPESYNLWDAETLRVVLSHERAHVRQRDFYIHALAGLHCTMFWFNPFSWWLRRQLSELGEALSDRAAVEEAESRTSYAETLLAFASRTRWPMSGVAMASAGNLTPRIERLLNDRGFERSFAPKQRLPFVAAGVVVLAMTASTAMERVRAASAGGPFNANTVAVNVAVNANAPVSNDESTPPTPPAPTTPPVPATPVSAVTPPAPPSPPVPPAKGHRYTYVEDDSDGKSGGEQILAIQSDHSKLMFDSGDELPRQPGDYIYFQHDGKPYLIQDPKIIAKANELLEPMKSLREEQRDLGRQQQMLGTQQRKLASPMIHFVQTPEFKIRMAELQKTIKEVDLPRLTAQIDVKAIDEKALAEVQANLGEIQARVGRLQAEIGRQGANISGEVAEKMGKIGEQQGKLGERQALLGDQQRKIVEDAKRQLQPMIEQAIREGKATPLAQ
jgi:beta-lactamase regulating signal transducer with metallopeptidase domain